MIKASCLCQKVQFTLDAGYTDIYQCHCSKCRKVSGTSSNAVLLVPSKSFAWNNGEEHINTYKMDDGWQSTFCTNCGSPLPMSDPDNTTYWVPAGLLDDDPGVEIGGHIYVDSKASWDRIGGNAPQFGGAME